MSGTSSAVVSAHRSDGGDTTPAGCTPWRCCLLARPSKGPDIQRMQSPQPSPAKARWTSCGYRAEAPHETAGGSGRERILEQRLWLEDHRPMLPGQLQSAGAAWGHRLIDQQTADGRLIEPEVLTVVVHAHHTALVVALDQPIEDPIKHVSVKDGNGEDVADEVQRVNGHPESEDADPPGRVRLVEGPEWLLVGVVDGVTVAVMFGIAQEFLAVLAHHVAPQVKVRAVLGRQDAGRLEHAGGHDAEQPTRDGDTLRVPPQQHEGGAGGAASNGQGADRQQQRIGVQVERVSEEPSEGQVLP